MNRQALLHELLDELAAHSPAAAMRHMRHWPGGALSLVHLNVLAVLDIDGPLPMRGLAETLDVSQASATGIIDRMEQRGLVERARDVEDRRVVLARMTDEGRAAIAEHDGWRVELVEQLLEPLPTDQLLAVAAGVRRIRDEGAT